MSVSYEDFAFATAPPAAVIDNAADEAAIRALFQNLLDSWGRGDGAAYGDQFTEDADYVAFDGSHTRGRRQIAASHQQLFDTWLKGTRLTGEITGIRFLSPEVALVHATGGTLMPGRSEAKPVRPSIQTLVAVKRDGRWRFTAFHNTRIKSWNTLQYALFGIATKVFRR
jgi:uncharacterized protein (TIGR02246 family)